MSAVEGYHPDFDIDLRRGNEAESLVERVLNELPGPRGEVKRDDKALATGNAYVEHRCHRRDGWHPSGIDDTRADWWAQVIGDVIVIAPTERWRHAHRWAIAHKLSAACVVGSHPTEGAAIPLARLLSLLAGNDL